MLEVYSRFSFHRKGAALSRRGARERRAPWQSRGLRQCARSSSHPRASHQRHEVSKPGVVIHARSSSTSGTGLRACWARGPSSAGQQPACPAVLVPGAGHQASSPGSAAYCSGGARFHGGSVRRLARRPPDQAGNGPQDRPAPWRWHPVPSAPAWQTAAKRSPAQANPADRLAGMLADMQLLDAGA
jgi:hypothetical protein